MNLSNTFIRRPVATALLMVGVLLAGLIGYRSLPISALPEVDYPTLQVYTEYPGAGPDVTANTLTAPLERQLGQIAGLERMRSSSANGASVITLQFGLSTSLEEVEQEVQPRSTRPGRACLMTCLIPRSTARSIRPIRRC